MKLELGSAPKAIGWAAFALLASYALTSWLRAPLLAAGVGLWWAIVASVLVLAGFASPLVFLTKANTWAQSTVKWRTVALDLGGFLGTVAVTLSAALAIALYRGWLK